MKIMAHDAESPTPSAHTNRKNSEKSPNKSDTIRPRYFVYKYAQRSNIIVEFPQKEVDSHGEEEGKEEEINPRAIDDSLIMPFTSHPAPRCRQFY
jgi:hypothetical protein